jgi:hypothetical protein
VLSFLEARGRSAARGHGTHPARPGNPAYREAMRCWGDHPPARAPNIKRRRSIYPSTGAQQQYMNLYTMQLQTKSIFPGCYTSGFAGSGSARPPPNPPPMAPLHALAGLHGGTGDPRCHGEEGRPAQPGPSRPGPAPRGAREPGLDRRVGVCGEGGMWNRIPNPESDFRDVAEGDIGSLRRLRHGASGGSGSSSGAVGPGPGRGAGFKQVRLYFSSDLHY